MSDFTKKIIVMILEIVGKVVEVFTKVDINGDGKIG